MVEAYWTMYFNSQAQPFRGGTMVFAAGSIIGHDLEHEFHGTYRVAEDQIRVELRVLRYAKNPDSATLPHKFDVVLEGKTGTHRMVLCGHTLDQHPRFIRIVCVKRSSIHQIPATAMVPDHVRDGYAEISAINRNVIVE